MKYLSICSGIEAASVAWHPIAWQPLAFSEIEPFPRAVLSEHYPDVPCHGDFTVLRDQEWIVDADVLVGGTPCQAFSIAGLRNSLADERGNLSLEFVRLADAIDNFRLSAGREPAIIVWENVPGVLSVSDNAFGCFLAALAGDDTPYVPPRGKWTNAGVVAGSKRTIAWIIKDAQYFGVAQRRRRVFVVASSRKRFDPAAVLFEFQSVRRDTPPRRGEGQEASPASGTGFVGGFQSSQSGVRLTNTHATLDANNGSRRHNGVITGTLTAKFANPLGAAEVDAGLILPVNPVAYSIMPMNSGKDYKARETDVSQPLMAAGPVGGNQGGDFVAQPISFHPTQDPISNTDGISHALGCGSTTGQANVAIASNMQVRRLTPTECERLQGFPDGYTAIPWKKKDASECPDGPRYKALGNSMAVPVMRWIGERINNQVNQSFSTA